MKKLLLIAGLACSVLGQTTVLTHATVIDGTGNAPQRDTTIVMENGRIRDIGPSALVQAPAGALIDMSHAKRAIIVAAALVVTGASIILPFMSSFVFVAGSQAAAGTAEAFFGPAIAAITLGIMGPRALTRRIGRNESFNHAGNALAAALSGVCAWKWGPIGRLSPGWHGFAPWRLQ